MTPRSRKLLAPALSLSFLAVSFAFGNDGIHWIWSARPAVAVVVAIGAATAWVFLLRSLRSPARPRA